jgi:hypothetical protein
MPLEKYVIREISDLGGGEKTEIKYSDLFDPDKFKSIVTDSDVPLGMRRNCPHMLYNAEVLTQEELRKLLP